MTTTLELPEAPQAGSADVAAPAKKRGGGPRTEEGKMASRGNAMKHGMRAKVLLPDDLVEAVASRTEYLNEQFNPVNPYETWLIGEMARAGARLERLDELMIIDLKRVIERAELCWEADRGKEADALGARLQKEPWRVARALARSLQGADWMIEKWVGLAAALKSNGGWDEAQRSLAFDLLAVDPELRNGSDQLPPEGDAKALAGLVAEQLESLRYVQEVSLAPLDRAEQSMAAAGMPLREDACSARLRRHEAAQRRALHWALAELRRVREGLPPSQSPRPGAKGDDAPSEPAPAGPPLEARPLAPDSAMDSLARRSTLVTVDMLLRSAAPEPVDEEASAPIVEETPTVEAPPAARAAEIKVPEVQPRPAFAMTSAFVSPAQGNRRSRRAQEAQEQRAASKAPR